MTTTRRCAIPVALVLLGMLAFACASSREAGSGFTSDNGPNPQSPTAQGPTSQGADAAAPASFGSAAASGDAGASCASASLNQEGCACPASGKTQRCYGGDPTRAGIGACTWGTQTCSGNGEFQKWGPCTGYGTPNAEVCSDQLDHNCDGKAGSADPLCASDAGASDAGASDASDSTQTPASCNSGGHLYVNNLGYAQPVAGPPPYVCSSVAGNPFCTPFGQGGTFTANCAGTYQVCARVVSIFACDIANSCVSVTVPADGATVPLDPFPAWGPLTNACLMATFPDGSFSTTLDVTGTTTSGIAVNRPNLVTGIDPVGWGGGGPNGGSGGGGF